MSLLALAGLGVSGVGALTGAIGMPTITTIAVSTAGPMVVKWALTRYIRNNLGNYFYVYELVTGATPDHVATGTGGALSLALTAASIGTSLLVVTALGTGKLAYKLVSNTTSLAASGVSAGVGATVGATRAAIETVTGGSAATASAEHGEDGIVLLSLRDAISWNAVDVEPEEAVFERLRRECGDEEELHRAMSLYRTWYVLEAEPDTPLEDDWQVVGEEYLTGSTALESGKGDSLSDSLYVISPRRLEALHRSRALQFECEEGDAIVEDYEVSLTASLSGSMTAPLTYLTSSGDHTGLIHASEGDSGLEDLVE